MLIGIKDKYSIICQPIDANKLPPKKEDNATLPKIIKSVRPWTIGFSFGLLLLAITSLPPTNKKFHASPQQNNDSQKWCSVCPMVPKKIDSK